MLGTGRFPRNEHKHNTTNMLGTGRFPIEWSSADVCGGKVQVVIQSLPP
jgi:hypothetical protein